MFHGTFMVYHEKLEEDYLFPRSRKRSGLGRGGIRENGDRVASIEKSLGITRHLWSGAVHAQGMTVDPTIGVDAGEKERLL